MSGNIGGILKWWIDGSLVVNTNMIGNTGGGLSMGRGFPIFSSTIQKLNMQISTETDILEADDCMPVVILTRYWLDAQGYDVFEKIVHQDNKSAILLENNGKGSSSKRTKHINIRYYFVTDCIENMNST